MADVAYALARGCWVTGRSASGLYGLPDHRGHVLVLTGDPVPSSSNAGYRQAVWCLDCGTGFATKVDGEFLQNQCTDGYLHADLDRLDLLIKRAKKARKRIVKELTS